MAKEANVNFDFSISSNKCKITFFGFNNSLKEGFKEILNFFKNIDLNNKRCLETLELQLKEQLKNIKNKFLDQSFKVNLQNLGFILNEPVETPEELINFLSENKVTYF